MSYKDSVDYTERYKSNKNKKTTGEHQKNKERLLNKTISKQEKDKKTPPKKLIQNKNTYFVYLSTMLLNSCNTSRNLSENIHFY